MTKKKKTSKPTKAASSPVHQLETELSDLRRDLRKTVKAYVLRLEADLQKSSAAVQAFRSHEELSREDMHEVRDMTMLLRRRKLKPEKGRRKDLRKIDALIEDLQMFVTNGDAGNR